MRVKLCDVNSAAQDKLPQHTGPKVPKHESECGCLDDSPYLGFIGDDVEEDLLFNLN